MAVEPGEPLSERELEITELVSEGLTNREIAERLYLSHNTVKVHLRNVFTKTGVASRTELSMLAVQEGWITIPGLSEEPGDTSDSAEADASAIPEREVLPMWPWQRWSALAVGICLALIVLLLPQRGSAPASASGPGDVFGSGGASVGVAAPASENGWEELAPLPVRRAGMATVALEGRIFAIGGMTDGGASNRVDIYDVESDQWRGGRPRPAELANIDAVALKEGILVPGGCEDDAQWTPSAVVHLYDPNGDTWSQVTSLPTPLCAYALTVYRDQAYLFGGWDGDAYRAITLAYDPGENAWRDLAPPAQARGFGAAAALEDRILYVGGYSDDQEWATCEMYFPDTNTWESCQPMLQPRGGLSLTAIGGRVYAIGGGWRTPLGFNERYTPSTGEWSVVETPIVGEWRNLGAVASDTSIYAIGGWSDAGFLNGTYTLAIMPWRVFIPGTFRTP